MEKINNGGHLSTGEVSPSGVLTSLYEAGLKPGVNWQKELTELIIDIAFRENISCLEVLKVPQIQTVLNHKKLSSPQKLEKVKNLLFARRYPTVFLARKVFNQELKKLKISPKIKVRVHPYFEEESLRLEYGQKYAELEEVKVSLRKLRGADLVKNALKIAEDNS